MPNLIGTTTTTAFLPPRRDGQEGAQAITTWLPANCPEAEAEEIIRDNIGNAISVAGNFAARNPGKRCLVSIRVSKPRQ